MECAVSSTSGSFGSCYQEINPNDFNRDSVFWYIENEDSIYNFKLTLFPYLSSTPLKTIYPIIESVDLKTFKKTRSFPEFFEEDPQLLPSLLPFTLNGALSSEFNLQKTDEPAISFDSKNNIFDLSFVGELPKGMEGVLIYNYRFKKSGNILNPYSINVYTPDVNTWGTAFGNGYLSPNIDLQSYPKSVGSYMLPLSIEGVSYLCYYGPPCQDITAVHNLERNSLKFNSTSIDTLSTFAPNVSFLNFTESFDPSKKITLTFDLAAYYMPGQQYLTTNHSLSVCNTRTITTFEPVGIGEGFCVYFHSLSSHKDFIGSGPGTCLGYSAASAVEVDGFNGYLIDFNQGLYGGHLGLGFDIGGGFPTTIDGKNGTTGTRNPNTITLRSSQSESFRVLHTSNNLSAFGLTLAQSVTSLADVKFNTYRIILDSNGRRIRASILDCDTEDFIDLFCYEIDFLNGCDINPNILTPGLSFSTGEYACNFELMNINIQGYYKTPDTADCIPPHIPTPTPTCPEIYIGTSTPTPTPTPSATYTPTPTPPPQYTYTPTPTPDFSYTPTPTISNTGTSTPTPTPTETYVATPTPTSTPTNTATPTNTPTNTPTPSESLPPGVSPSNTRTPTPTPTGTPTGTPTSTPTSTPTATPTNTPTSTPTPSPSAPAAEPMELFMASTVQFIEDNRTTFEDISTPVTVSNSFIFDPFGVSPLTGATLNEDAWFYDLENVVDYSGVSFRPSYNLLLGAGYTAETYSYYATARDIYTGYFNLSAGGVFIDSINVIETNVSLITPQHGLCAAHFRPRKGTSLHFYDTNGNLYKRIVEDVYVHSFDIAIVKLETPITDSAVKKYKLAKISLPTNDYIGTGSNYFPIYMVYGKLLNRSITDSRGDMGIICNQLSNPLAYNSSTNQPPQTITWRGDKSLTRVDISLPDKYLGYPHMYSGDSSGPCFVIYNNEFLLISSLWTAGYGPNYSEPTLQEDIRTGIADMGNPYGYDFETVEIYDVTTSA